MKSVHLVLGCCLMFAAVMMVGLSLHSCKSKKAVERSVQVNSVGMSAYKEELDSFAFRRLMERHNKHWTLEILSYRPVYDTVGQVKDTYLERRMLMTHHHEQERDSAGADAMLRMQSDTTEVMVDREEETEEKPLADEYKIFFVILLMMLLFVRIKK